MRIVFIQNGDYRETVQRFAQGGGETYYAQRYSVDFVAELLQRNDVERVSVLCVRANPTYKEELLGNGVHAVGVHVDHGGDVPILEAMERNKPTHLILRTPRPVLLRHAVTNRIETQCMFADSFESGGLRARLRNRRLARLLNDPHFGWIGNHQLDAAESLARTGVSRDKIIPWDWPPLITPEQFEPKTRHDNAAPITLFFAGVVSVPKGVSDCLHAVAMLRQKQLDVRFLVAGDVKENEIRECTRKLGLEECVEFLGRIEHSEVLRRMNEADAVLVPSRHEYPEGLPMVIYDGFCSRTPLVVSDHPMFSGKVVHEESGMVFRAADPNDLAARIEQLMADANLYETISRNTAAAWEKLQLPVTWGDLITRFLDGVVANQKWATAMRLPN